jgi:hypothetical protein
MVIVFGSQANPVSPANQKSPLGFKARVEFKTGKLNLFLQLLVVFV